MPKEEEKKKNSTSVCERKRERERDGVRRSEHKSVALLGWMLTPVRDY